MVSAFISVPLGRCCRLLLLATAIFKRVTPMFNNPCSEVPVIYTLDGGKGVSMVCQGTRVSEHKGVSLLLEKR